MGPGTKNQGLPTGPGIRGQGPVNQTKSAGEGGRTVGRTDGRSVMMMDMMYDGDDGDMMMMMMQTDGV